MEANVARNVVCMYGSSLLLCMCVYVCVCVRERETTRFQ